MTIMMGDDGILAGTQLLPPGLYKNVRISFILTFNWLFFNT